MYQRIPARLCDLSSRLVDMTAAFEGSNQNPTARKRHVWPALTSSSLSRAFIDIVRYEVK